MALLVHEDDIVLASNDSQANIDFKTYVHSLFSIKDLGPLKYFLGIKVAHGPKGLFLSQWKYALEIVDEYRLLGAKPSDTPIKENHKLALAIGTHLDDAGRYRCLVGGLIYLTITRPDLFYAIHILSQFIQAPRKEHLEAACKVLRYIKGSLDYRILLHANVNLQLTAFCDSDWGVCPLTRRSLIGYLVTLGGSPISWKTKKQATISRLLAEAEYRSMASATSELVWIKALLAALGVFHTQAMHLFCDSQTALNIAKNPVFYEHTKHIEMDCHFVHKRYHYGCLLYTSPSPRDGLLSRMPSSA